MSDTQNIVFILGAGASKSYGFPTGGELYKSACSARSAWADTLDRVGGVERAEITEFIEALRGSRTGSIDAFLEYRAGTRFLRLGKLAIAAQLIAKENPGHLNSAGLDEDWYQYFINNFLDLQSNSLQRDNCDVRLVTYNYDRSFEIYLFDTIRYRFGLSADVARERVQSLDIVHMHGQLGMLTELSETRAGRPYRELVSRDTLDEAVSHIQILHEEIPTDRLEKVHRWIANAHEIVFLGFGFHPLNMHRLQLDQLCIREKEQWCARIWATTYGLTESEALHQVLPLLPTLDRKRDQFHAPRNNIRFGCSTVLEFLRNHAELTVA